MADEIYGFDESTYLRVCKAVRDLEEIKLTSRNSADSEMPESVLVGSELLVVEVTDDADDHGRWPGIIYQLNKFFGWRR